MRQFTAALCDSVRLSIKLTLVSVSTEFAMEVTEFLAVRL